MSVPKAHPAKCGTRPGEKASTYFIPSRSSKQQQQQQQNRHKMVKPSRIRVRSIALDSNQEEPRDTFLIYSKNVARTSRVRLCAVRNNGEDNQEKVGRRFRVVYFRSEQMEGGVRGLRAVGVGGKPGGGGVGYGQRY